MSSHHIIREKQEPALLILAIESFDQEHLGQLLEWSPSVIVSEDIYEHVLSFGIKIDVLLKQSKDKIETQEHVKVHEVKEGDLLQSAMSFLTKEEYPSVNILTAEFHAGHYEPYVNKLDIVVFTDSKKIFPIKSGFTKWKPALENIYIMSEKTIIKSFTGLNEENKQQYRTLKDGFYGLTFDNIFIFIAEDL